jgi:hypothetical protein
LMAAIISSAFDLLYSAMFLTFQKSISSADNSCSFIQCSSYAATFSFDWGAAVRGLPTGIRAKLGVLAFTLKRLATMRARARLLAASASLSIPFALLLVRLDDVSFEDSSRGSGGYSSDQFSVFSFSAGNTNGFSASKDCVTRCARS